MFELSLQSSLIWIGLLAALMIINELLRLSKWFSWFFFLILPIGLTLTLWTSPAQMALSQTNDWFHWAKLYSVIAAGIGFTAMRFTRLGEVRLMKFFPVLILAVNILEAVLRDFEVGSGAALLEKVPVAGGINNYMNGIAGILSIITICGWSGIFINKKSKSDMLWPDMTVFWIIAYDVWNFAYIYNCIPSSAFFGLAVLLSCTLPCLLIKKGTWIQARAFTLTAWMMLLFTFPVYLQQADHVALPAGGGGEVTGWKIGISALSLLLNIAFFGYHFYKVIKKKRFVPGVEIHDDTAGSKAIKAMEA